MSNPRWTISVNVYFNSIVQLSFVHLGTFISKYTVFVRYCVHVRIMTINLQNQYILKTCFIPAQSNHTAQHQIPLQSVHPQQSQSSVTVFFHFHLTLDEVKAQYCV